MKAYGIFDGGGVKGAALAGCLAAAEDHEVEFVGYGGTSAGSIVAALAAAGYGGREVLQLMKGTFKPLQLLDDDGVKLRKVKECQEQAERLISSKKWKVLKLFEATSLYGEFEQLLCTGGLYTGQRFREAMLGLLKHKLGLPENQTDVTFDDFVQCNRRPLKIVASDLTGRRVAKFSAQDTKYGRSVVDAVRASAGYPFLFQPVHLKDGARLADGGLSSNLPTFLFTSEHELTQYPILAFDLVANSERHNGSLVQLLADLLGTALEAPDEIIHSLGAGVVPIHVPVPNEISTLKFDLSDTEIDQLFSAGLNSTSEFLGNWPQLKLARQAGADIQLQLWTIYGDRKLFESPLYALAQMIETRTRAKDVRSQVMLNTGRLTNSRIVTYTYGYRSTDGDADLELGEFGGCSGRALGAKKPMVADLIDAKRNFADDWKMTEAQQAKVASDRKSMMSFPILAWSQDKSIRPEQLPVIGVLSVDSSTPLAETGWFREGALAHEGHLRGDVTDIMKVWADVISKLLR
jgi:NTE family protein